MKNTHELKTGGFYVFESLASANSVFFKSEKEIKIFKKLFKLYVSRYMDINKLYVDASGYQAVVRIKQRKTLLKNYRTECNEKKRDPKKEIVKNPWRIISEKMRIFKSIFVKAINKLRGREGVLVKHSFKKYYFESIEEYNLYVVEMESGKHISSQRNQEYSLSRSDSKILNWMKYRAGKWAESLLSIRLQD